VNACPSAYPCSLTKEQPPWPSPPLVSVHLSWRGPSHGLPLPRMKPGRRLPKDGSDRSGMAPDTRLTGLIHMTHCKTSISGAESNRRPSQVELGQCSGLLVAFSYHHVSPCSPSRRQACPFSHVTYTVGRRTARRLGSAAHQPTCLAQTDAETWEEEISRKSTGGHGSPLPKCSASPTRIAAQRMQTSSSPLSTPFARPVPSHQNSQPANQPNKHRRPRTSRRRRRFI
jgi:hypothetical protein